MNDEVNTFDAVSGSLTLTGYGPHIRIDDVTSHVHKAEEGGYWAEVPALPGGSPGASRLLDSGRDIG